MEEFLKDPDLSWLMLAICQCNPTQRWMECLHVIDGMGYTTDGHRMHVAPVPVVDGIYDVFVSGLDITGITLLTREQAGVPDSLDMAARFEEWRDQICTDGKVTTLSGMINKGGFFGAAITKDGVARINRGYLIQALYGMTDGEKTSIKYGLLKGGNNAVYGTDGARGFVIIGLRDGAIDLGTVDFKESSEVNDD